MRRKETQLHSLASYPCLPKSACSSTACSSPTLALWSNQHSHPIEVLAPSCALAKRAIMNLFQSFTSWSPSSSNTKPTSMFYQDRLGCQTWLLFGAWPCVDSTIESAMNSPSSCLVPFRSSVSDGKPEHALMTASPDGSGLPVIDSLDPSWMILVVSLLIPL